MSDKMASIETPGYRELTEEQWFDEFEPVMEEGADGSLKLFEWKSDTEVLSEACAQDRIWTMMSDDNGDLCISEGNRLVNRLHNLVTKKPWEPGVEYYVKLE